jgi:hypothetical protein
VADAVATRPTTVVPSQLTTAVPMAYPAAVAVVVEVEVADAVATRPVPATPVPNRLASPMELSRPWLRLPHGRALVSLLLREETRVRR